MKIDPDDFRVPEGKKVRLEKWPTRVKPFCKSEDEFKAVHREDTRTLSELQRLLYASDSYSLLLIFQAMDAAGKDGTISHVLTGINPQGCEVFSFKHPSDAELEHDFLWRTTRCLPARGRIGVFNRSYYEEVLIARVHPKILKGERIPEELTRRDAVWKNRFRSITGLERHLHRNGTRVLKFFLHLSRGEQRKRFLKRIDEPEKNWKFSSADMVERKYWDTYMSAYEECLTATSSNSSPWYVVPADDKLNAHLLVSKIVIQALQDLDLRYPRLTHARLKELKKLRRLLAG